MNRIFFLLLSNDVSVVHMIKEHRKRHTTAPNKRVSVSAARLIVTQVLEYCLFQPGIFTNYLTFPYNSSKHVDLFEIPINFDQRRAIIVEGDEDHVITVTTAQDLAKVVALAVEYEGEWPLVGGIRGANITVSELIKLGEKIRGK